MSDPSCQYPGMLPICQLLESPPRPGARCWVHGAGLKGIQLPEGLHDGDECTLIDPGPKESQTSVIERRSDGRRFSLRSKIIDFPMAWKIDGRFLPETAKQVQKALRDEAESRRRQGDPRADLIEWMSVRSYRL